MKDLTATQIRSDFLKYFEKQGHTTVASSSLVPQNDPTLLFTNAGMVQFKDTFLGDDPRPYKRAASSQKCVRAGGKHNDLENVGFTARHHTFFEMLGNFSFGDYFKKDAIHFAWEFVTKNLGIDKKHLHVTVYNDDEEAAKIWAKQEKVAADRITRHGEKDNFWAMGETGPCGPCSEIFIDRGPKTGCQKPSCKVGCECDRFMEIWNLVFMQFERNKKGKLSPLPKPSIDTGMGLERVASVLQNVDTNYDIDLFRNLIGTISHLAKVKYGKDKASDGSLKVIADHCRATNFLIADGVLPSNEGRGYVLRRIMRRAIRHGHKLGLREPFFYKVTKPLIDQMGTAYPELNDKQEYLETTIKLEEERFLKTLDNGLEILEDLGFKDKKKSIDGALAFKLYDTYGFPLDLTRIISEERGFKVDEKGFEKEMEKQRSRSREHWKGSGESAIDAIFQELHKKGLKSKFKGYKKLACDGDVLAIVEEGKSVKSSSTGTFQVIFDETPFYAESGGQVGDKGKLKAKHFEADVVDVQKPVGKLIVVYCENAKGKIKVGQEVDQITERKVRALTTKNHTATHIMHHALRKFLGNHVKQAGSLVTPELLRFDFTHTKPLTPDEILKIENFINEKIALAEEVDGEEMDKEKALKKGAIAFFGDKYGSKVRVITVGDYSVELCGGTHVRNTAEIQAFKILNENGIAAGVRRIVAITGPAVVAELQKKTEMLQKIMNSVKASAPQEILTKIEKLQASEKELKRAVQNQSKESASKDLSQWIGSAVDISGGKFIRAKVPVSNGENPAKALRELSDLIRSKVSRSVVALAAEDQEKKKTLLLVSVTKDMLKTHQANNIIRQVAPIIDGKGGGKPDMAQAGGTKNNFDEAFSAIEKLLHS